MCCLPFGHGVRSFVSFLKNTLHRIRGIKQKMEDQSNEAEKFRQPEPSARGLEEEKMRQMEQLRPLPKKKSPNPQPPAAEMQVCVI